MKIVVGSDHAGFPMKAELLAFLRERGHESARIQLPLDHHSHHLARGVHRDEGVRIAGGGVRAAAFERSVCCSSTCSICRPIVSTGFSDVIGSWKIIAISRPRIVRICGSGV